jgi:starch-binding outer membrane protein, SusD/RagB family
MKKINLLSIKLSIVSIVLLLTSCYSDLDPQDQGGNLLNATNVYKTDADYKRGLAKLYAAFAVSGQQGPAGKGDISGIDEGFGQYLRAYWNAQELTTDEAVIAWNDQTIKDYHWHSWTSIDVFNQALYYRIIYTVSLCNEFIRASSKSTSGEVKQYKEEARFLRALAYSHAIDLYGNVPFVTDADAVGSTLPKQIKRADLFNYVESELIDLDAKGLLGSPKFEYGRADKAAVWMLLAKLYLNAQVYAGQSKYTECLTYVNKVIASPYQLASGSTPFTSAYGKNFLADNHTSPEIIFAINFDGKSTQTFGGMTYIINASLGGSMNKEADFGSKSGWSGLRTTSALAGLFSSGDNRDMLYKLGQSLEINDIGLFTDGYAVGKFRNRTASGLLAENVAYSASGDTFMDVDFPMFRLADAYLMYAEAVLRGGSGGSSAQALAYVNQLRTRATTNTITQAQLDKDFVLDERARELYWEAHRRTDLIRYGKFSTGTYVWAWKGNVKNGKATEAFRDLFPLPSADLAANPGLEQNDGYSK